MENQTSFIPKQVLTRQITPRREGIGLFTVISVVVFVVSVLFSGGVWGYKYMLKEEITRPCPATASTGEVVTKGCGLVASLGKLENSLNNEQSLIKKIERLDSKIKKATGLITEHNTILPIFNVLERLTLETVGYSSFGFDGQTLNLSGKARSYESIALQSDVFSENSSVVKSFVFSGLNVGEDDSVNFQLTLVVDPSLSVYTKYLEL